MGGGPSPRAGNSKAMLNISGGANASAAAANTNLGGTMQPKTPAGRKISKESAIGLAFKNEISEGTLNLSGRLIGDQ